MSMFLSFKKIVKNFKLTENGKNTIPRLPRDSVPLKQKKQPRITHCSLLVSFNLVIFLFSLDFLTLTFLRVIAGYFVECFSVWVCPMILHDQIQFMHFRPECHSFGVPFIVSYQSFCPVTGEVSLVHLKHSSVPGLSCSFRDSVLESAVSSRSPGSCQGGRCWGPGVLTTVGVSLRPGFLTGQSWGTFTLN